MSQVVGTTTTESVGKELLPGEILNDIASDWDQYRSNPSILRLFGTIVKTAGNVVRLSPYTLVAGKALIRYGTKLTATHPLVGKAVTGIGKGLSWASRKVLGTTKTAVKAVSKEVASYAKPFVSAFGEAAGALASGYVLLASGVELAKRKSAIQTSTVAIAQKQKLTSLLSRIGFKTDPKLSTATKQAYHWGKEVAENPIKYVWDVLTFRYLKDKSEKEKEK